MVKLVSASSRLKQYHNTTWMFFLSLIIVYKIMEQAEDYSTGLVF